MEQRSTGIVKSHSLAREGEGLAGESPAEDIEVWEGSLVEFSNICWLVIFFESFVVDSNGVLVEVAVADAGKSTFVVLPWFSLTVGAIPVGS
jgi:hypothetical protein